MNIYHIELEDDKKAQQTGYDMTPALQQVNGHAAVSRSFGHGPAILVVSLPDGVDITTVTELPASLVQPGQEIDSVYEGQPLGSTNAPVPQVVEQQETMEQPASLENDGGESSL